MWSLNFVVAGCLCMFVLAGPCCCDPMLGSDSGMKPIRPKNFATPKDLRMYLDQLGEFYALAGRPRFGKRTAAATQVKRDPQPPSYQYQEQQPTHPDFPDILDILQQYYQPQEQD